uniref:Calcium/calmodulin dependent protein kinase II inhibitor 1-like n=1 Tax=Paramormyrops kingsleyae TaxID=1676925 RepID=A0A3B3Q7X5_9TELE
MLYCCGSKEEKESASLGALMKSEEEEARDKDGGSARAARELHGLSGIPELLPATAPSHPSPGRLDPARVQTMGVGFSGNSQSFDSPQRRLGQRAPKLGQIGRSKRVIEDEDLDDIMNNN